MTAAREIIAALVAAGMDALDAAALVARAAVEMSSDRPSKATLRTRKWRAGKASQNVTGDAPVTPTELPSQSATERHQPSQNVTPETPPLILTSFSSEPKKDLEEQKESKRARPPKTRHTAIPADWHPPERAHALAAEFGGKVAQIEPRFRDYLASSGKLYADYDAAFCNFVRNTPKFSGTGKSNGKSVIAAQDRLNDKLAEFAKPDLLGGIRGEEGASHVRMLPARRGG